ncbi:MAG: hypothetical protein HZC55_27445 [Verrucomicrobia bacterium]|nr:hypothetical protein [Verrucomicrobiota bacterium]
MRRDSSNFALRLRRMTAGSAGLAVLLWFAPAAGAGTRHLWLDSALLAANTETSLTINPPSAGEIVLRRDRPWESFMITFYVSVVDEGERLRMWYDTRESTQVAHLAYAESTDGVHWTKPELGIVTHSSGQANNLVGVSSLEGNVFRDPQARTEAERYVYVSSVYRGGGIYRFTSPDGLRWRRDSQPLLPFEGDSQNVTLWDPALGRYVLFLRGWDRLDPRNQWRRLVRTEAERLDQPLPVVPGGKGRHAGDPGRAPLITDELPVVFACDAQDPADTDVYTNAIQRYPLAPEWYVGFPSLYRHAPKSTHRNDGRTETHFIASRDGVKWERYSRAPYVRPGLPGSEMENMVYLGTGFVIRGDEIWHYGTGYRTTHGDTPGRQRQADGAVFRWVQRVDGFVSLDTGLRLGTARTRPVRVDGRSLRLNLDTGALGEMRVGLLDRDGAPIAGRGADDCRILQINATGAQVTWADGGDLESLQGREVCVEFRSTRTKLYSFRFE